MKITVKDIILIAGISVLSFPVIYFAMLFATGRAKIEFINPSKKKVTETEFKYQKRNSKLDSLQVMNTESYMASVKERAGVAKEKEALVKQQERINILISELNRTREELAQQRAKFERLVEKNDELEAKQIKQLANVYGAMRPNEAATILETLNDDLFIKIIKAIGDDRQKGKIMAAISKSKASRVSKKMGKSIR